MTKERPDVNAPQWDVRKTRTLVDFAGNLLALYGEDDGARCVLECADELELLRREQSRQRVDYEFGVKERAELRRRIAELEDERTDFRARIAALEAALRPFAELRVHKMVGGTFVSAPVADDVEHAAAVLFGKDQT